MDVRKMEVKQSALSSLKSELIRKKEECHLLKRDIDNVPRKKLKPLENTDVSSDGTSVVSSLDRDPDEEELLRRSRKCLESKARIYDEKTRSSGGNTEEHDSESLVDFSQKRAEEKIRDVSKPSNMNNKSDETDKFNVEKDNSDWVEYVDFLGRTRKCLKEDLEYMKEKDHDFMKKVSKEDGQEECATDTTPVDKINQRPEFLQRLHEDWEKQEQQLKDKEDIHYQDVFFDEARAHGVGYYAFSTDEKARAAQQEALQRLRQETKKFQQNAKQKAIQTLTQSTARVEAAKERMLKLLQAAIGGGDSAGSEKATAIIDSVKAAMEATQKEVVARNMEQLEYLKKEDETEIAAPDQEEVSNPVETDDLKRKYHIRPWDEGKEGVGSQKYVGYVRTQEKELMSQEQWVAKKREERPAEFAPLHEPDRSGEDVIEYSLPTVSKGPLFFSSKKETPSETPPSRTKLINKFQESSDRKMADTSSNVNVVADQTVIGQSDPYAGMTQTEISEAVEAGLKYLRQKAEERSTKSERGFINIV